MSAERFISGAILLRCWADLEPIHLRILWDMGCPVRGQLLSKGSRDDLTLIHKAQSEAEEKDAFGRAWEFSVAEDEGRLHMFRYDTLAAERLILEMGFRVRWERREEWGTYRREAGAEEKSEGVLSAADGLSGTTSGKSQMTTAQAPTSGAGTVNMPIVNPAEGKNKRLPVTQAVAAVLCGVNVRQIQNWDKGKCPDRYPGRYNLAVLKSWAENYQSGKLISQAARGIKRATPVDPQLLDVAEHENVFDSD